MEPGLRISAYRAESRRIQRTDAGRQDSVQERKTVIEVPARRAITSYHRTSVTVEGSRDPGDRFEGTTKASCSKPAEPNAGGSKLTWRKAFWTSTGRMASRCVTPQQKRSAVSLFGRPGLSSSRKNIRRRSVGPGAIGKSARQLEAILARTVIQYFRFHNSQQEPDRVIFPTMT